jgi:hypothetical protein
VTGLNKTKAGLALGLLLGVLQLVWAILLAAIPGPLQSFLNFVFKVHSLQPYWVITNFNLLNAIILIVGAFVDGFILGWVFAAFWNWVNKNKK